MSIIYFLSMPTDSTKLSQGEQELVNPAAEFSDQWKADINFFFQAKQEEWIDASVFLPGAGPRLYYLISSYESLFVPIF